MMTETLMAVEPQEEEQTHPTPAAFVADEIPRLEPAEAEPVVLSSAETQLLRGEASGIPAASFPVRKDAVVPKKFTDEEKSRAVRMNRPGCRGGADSAKGCRPCQHRGSTPRS